MENDMVTENTELLNDTAINLPNIKPKEIEAEKYLVNNKLIVNSEGGNLLNELKRSLSECQRFYFSVAFINLAMF